MYQLIITEPFKERRDSLIKKDPKFAKMLTKTLRLLTIDPHYPSLNSHQVETPDFGKRYSSYVTGNIRLIWDYTDTKLMLILLDLGGHSGKNKVYK